MRTGYCAVRMVSIYRNSVARARFRPAARRRNSDSELRNGAWHLILYSMDTLILLLSALRYTS
jgi:hypothetical protein